MRTLEKREWLNKARCLNCGMISGYTKKERHCCEVPNYITWDDLVKREREMFILLMQAELQLKNKYGFASDAEPIYNKIKELINA